MKRVCPRLALGQDDVDILCLCDVPHGFDIGRLVLQVAVEHNDPVTFCLS